MAFYSSRRLEENGFLSPCCIVVALSESISSPDSSPSHILRRCRGGDTADCSHQHSGVNFFLFQLRETKRSNATPRNPKFKSNSRCECEIRHRRLPPNGNQRLSHGGWQGGGCASRYNLNNKTRVETWVLFVLFVRSFSFFYWQMNAKKKRAAAAAASGAERERVCVD